MLCKRTGNAVLFLFIHLVDLFIGILTSAIAAFIWLFFFRNVDHFKPEKWLPILGFFGLGCLSVLFPLLLPSIFEYDELSFASAFVHEFMSVGLIEETGKMLCLLIGMSIGRKLFTDRANFLIYGACVGLGFGFIENILYAQSYGNLVLHARAVISLSLHAFLTGIVGYGISCLMGKTKVQVLLWFVCAVLIHSLFNTGFDVEALHPVAPFLSYFTFFVGIEMYTTMMNNAVNQSAHFSDASPFPASAIRKSMLLSFGVLFFIFLLLFLAADGFAGIGEFLFFSGPLMFILYIAINRLTSMVFVQNKRFTIFPALPFSIGRVDLQIMGYSRGRITVKGLPYDEEPFLRHYQKRIQISPINLNFDYFGDSAEIEITEKVYAMSQLIFYKIQFHQSGDPVHEDRHFYLIPKLTGDTETKIHLIAGLISRDEAIDSSTEEIGPGSFCAWVYIEKAPEKKAFQHFIELMKN